MIENLQSLISFFEAFVFSGAARYIAFFAGAFAAAGVIFIVFRALFSLAAGLRSGGALLLPGPISFKRAYSGVIAVGAFAVCALLTAFLTLTSISVFLNALYMLAAGSPGLLGAENIIRSPRQDAPIYFLFSALYGLLGAGAFLSAYALWPLRERWIPWADRLRELDPETLGGKLFRVTVLQTFAFTNLLAVVFTVPLAVYTFKLFDRVAFHSGVFLSHAEAERLSALDLLSVVLSLAVIVAVNAQAAFALWPLRSDD